jgi:hypothetical protein
MTTFTMWDCIFSEIIFPIKPLIFPRVKNGDGVSSFDSGNSEIAFP